MDRCALFVDAGYLLGDDAVTSHGDRQPAIGWDYPALLEFLTGLARDHTGLPVLRCYWYELADDGCRAVGQEMLTGLPGLKLRPGSRQPGRGEGAEAGIRRDLGMLARNRAISDAVIVCADEGLSRAIADAQDAGIRVLGMQVSGAARPELPRRLGQEYDEVIEVAAASLRPFAQLPPASAERGGELYASLARQPPDPLAMAGERIETPVPVPAPAYPAAAQFQRSGQSLGSAAGQQAGLLPVWQTTGLAPAGPPGPPVPADPLSARRQDQAYGAPGSQADRLDPDAGTVNGQWRYPPPGPLPRPAVGLPPQGLPQAAPPGDGLFPSEGPPPAAYFARADRAGSGPRFPPAPSPDRSALPYADRDYGRSDPVPRPERPPAAVTSESIAAAHAEGFGFGQLVVRDAPRLWLEAVLARSPRMPSDLEARLVQGSAVPIEALLHDEIRNALRQGFWDALERVRR